MSVPAEAVERSGPHVFIAGAETDLPVFVKAHQREIEAGLRDRGGVLFRGFDINTPEDYDSFVASVSSNRMDYVYGSTPRRSVGEKIFTATEYPPAKEIPLHSEVSYHTEWPRKISLCCLVPAATGGATSFADLRLVSAEIGESLMNEFTERKVRYVRHYYPHIDVPWQQVFRTESKEEVTRFCEAHEIELEWLEDGVLRTSQVCQGTHVHPDTGETFIFNQVNLFHISMVEPDNLEAMKEMFGTRLPRNAYFGDGSEIPTEVVHKVANAFKNSSIDLDWEQGDVALLDNFRAAHGRRSFSGERKVLAALMDPVVGERFKIPGRADKKPWWKVW